MASTPSIRATRIIAIVHRYRASTVLESFPEIPENTDTPTATPARTNPSWIEV